jgi:hypothetical protein
MEVGKSEKFPKLFEFYKEVFLYVCRELKCDVQQIYNVDVCFVNSLRF